MHPGCLEEVTKDDEWPMRATESLCHVLILKRPDNSAVNSNQFLLVSLAMRFVILEQLSLVGENQCCNFKVKRELRYLSKSQSWRQCFFSYGSDPGHSPVTH